MAENYSQEMPGRLRVIIPVRDGDANQLKWAKMAMPYMGRDWGSYFLPEKEGREEAGKQGGGMMGKREEKGETDMGGWEKSRKRRERKDGKGDER